MRDILSGPRKMGADDFRMVVGKELGQIVMFFEVRDFDGVYFLDVPRE
jgi:hypothetical protein